MAYTKNYYTVLNLPSPSPTQRATASTTSSQQPTTTATIRTAYRAALLAAHPDKATAQTRNAYTVDDVREAYTVLSSPGQRAEYDRWLVLRPDVLRDTGKANGSGSGAGSGSGGAGGVDEFVLGLEVLDLSDFVEEGEEGEGEGEMLWTRRCRCGDERGFRIREGELVDAEAHGEKEVLVGCSGCSLWVRVAFDVEEG